MKDNQTQTRVFTRTPEGSARVLRAGSKWAALAVIPLVLGFAAMAQAEQRAQPTRLTVQKGASGSFTNIVIDLDILDTNETVNLTVDITGAVGVTSATLNYSTFTAPVDNTLDTNAILTVVYDGTVPQTGVNEIAVIAANAWNYRLPIPINSAVIWNGNTNNNAYGTGANWAGGIAPTATDMVVFGSVGASQETGGTNGVTNVVISSSATVKGLRFSHGDQNTAVDQSYRVEIKPGVSLSVSGEDFTMLRDTINVFDEMWLEMFGGGNLVVSNSAANWSIVGETASANDLVLNMGGLKSFTAHVDRVGLGNYELYPNFGTNGYGTEPDQWVPNVTLAESNFIRTAWIGGEALVTNPTMRPYAFTLEKMPEGSGHSSGQTHTLILGRTNVFFVESICFSGEGGKSSGNSVSFNTDTNVIPTNVVPVAYFRAPDGVGRVSVFAIADNSGVGGSGQSSKGTVNLTGGKADALIDRLYVGRDRLESTDNASGQGELSIGGDKAAGTIFDVNTAYISMQELGNNQSDPNDDDDPSGEVIGDLNVGANAVFKVNDTLYIGYTTADANDKRDAESGDGQININGGVLMANTIQVGGITMVSRNNTISINNGGELIVTNSIGSTTKGLATLSMSDGILTLHVDGNNATPYVYADSVVTGGGGNTIRIASLDNVSTFPTQIALIAYNSASPNFGVEFVVPNRYGYVVNNTANSTIDMVVLDTPPVARVWNGSPGTEWNTNAPNWKNGEIFKQGDTATFDDTATTPSVNVTATVYLGGAGVLVTNDTKAYTMAGVGRVAGTAPMNKWGTNSLTLNSTNELPLTVNAGSVAGSGEVGATIVKSNASLSFSGRINRLTTSGNSVLGGTAQVDRGATVNGGTLTNSGRITGFLDARDSQVTVASGGFIITDFPGTSQIRNTNTTFTLSGVWSNGIVATPVRNGTYRIDVLGTMNTTGRIGTGLPNTTHGSGTAPAYWSRLVIGSGGVLSPGATPGSITVFTNQSQLDFSTGSRIVIDVDMDSAPGSNPKGNVGTGSTTAKNSDVIFSSRWSTRTGTIRLNRLGSTPWTNGTVIKVFGKQSEQVGGAFRNRVFDGVEGQKPVIDPPSPGPGLLWDLESGPDGGGIATNGIITIVGTASTPPFLEATPFQGTNITFSWPEGYQGWELQTQFNALDVGLNTNWSVLSVVGSSTNTSLTITNWIGNAPGIRAYRMAHPRFE